MCRALLLGGRGEPSGKRDKRSGEALLLCGLWCADSCELLTRWSSVAMPDLPSSMAILLSTLTLSTICLCAFQQSAPPAETIAAAGNWLWLVLCNFGSNKVSEQLRFLLHSPAGGSTFAAIVAWSRCKHPTVFV